MRFQVLSAMRVASVRQTISRSAPAPCPPTKTALISSWRMTAILGVPMFPSS